MKKLNETEKKLLTTFERIIPRLTEKQKLRLLYFGEGMAFMKDNQDGGECIQCDQKPA